MKRESAAGRGYDARWRKYRLGYLTKHPRCAMCNRPATVVDHIEPHRGDTRKFWDPRNHQPLCKVCHDGAKKSQEYTGRLRGCDENGTPLDPRHHWKQGR
jgi:5-methylcytosine-specific restriction enzyme A